MENIPSSDYQGNQQPRANEPISQDTIVFTDNLPQPHGVNMKIVLSIVAIFVLGIGLYFTYSMFTKSETVGTAPALSTKSLVNQNPPAPVKKEDFKEPQPSAVGAPASESLICQNMEIPLPNNWNSLQKSENKSLDRNGCLMDAQGCLCVRKDDQGKGVVLSILVIVPPAGVTLETLMQNVPGTKTDIDKSDFLGYPAIRFIATDKSKIGNLNFLKGSQFFSINLGAEGRTFESLWPGFLAKTSAIKFK